MKRRWKRREQLRRRDDDLNTFVDAIEQTEFGEGKYCYIRMRNDGGNGIEIHRFKTQQAASIAMKYGQLYDHVKRPSAPEDPWSGGHPVRQLSPGPSESLN